MVERNESRLAYAVAGGAIALSVAEGATLGSQLRDHAAARGADVVFDAVGAEETRQAGFASLAPGGELVLVGLHHDETTLPLNVAIRNELTVRGVFAYSEKEFRTGLDWISSGRVGLHQGVVVAPLADGDSWYARLVEGDPATKVLLVPGNGASA